MQQEDIDEYIKRYTNRLNKYGVCRRSLGWNDDTPGVRYGIPAEYITSKHCKSILDVGCGFADFYEYLAGLGWSGKYTGIDIVPSLLNVAKSKYPTLTFHEIDVACEDIKSIGEFDFVIASEVFNATLKELKNIDHIHASIESMWNIAKVGISIDFLSMHDPNKYDGIWYSSPEDMLSFALSLHSKAIIRHDYIPTEFALIMLK